MAGGAAGNALAQRMKITDLPQMVAAFHSLVGLAAVTTSVANYMGHDPAVAMDSVHLVATYLGTWIGAVTLTGKERVVCCCKCRYQGLPGRAACAGEQQSSTGWAEGLS